MRTFQILTTAVITVSIAIAGGCGGPSTGLKKGGGVPPPPPNVKPDSSDPAKPEPKREFSKDAKKDYETALAAFEANDKSGWSESSCKDMAERFESVANEHSSLIEARFMMGLSYERCNLAGEAEKAYQAAIRIKPNHGQSLSNLGGLYLRAGKTEGAKQYFESALKATGKLVGAHVNLASIELDEMRRIGDSNAKWKDLEEDARFHLSSALGVDGNSVDAYTLYGLIYMEGYRKNKNRLDLAKVLLDEAKERNEKSPDLQNAYGLYYLHRSALSEALKHFKNAVEAKPNFAEARMNVGLITLRFRDYDQAKEQFSKVLELQPKNYDAIVGLGAALRGLKDFDGAEREYKRATDLQRGRGEAFYNLGVLYKDFKATKQEPQQSIATYRTAKGFFNDFLSKSGIEADDAKEAKEQIALIDKTILQTEKFLKALASQPPPPPPTPAPPPGGAPPAGAPPAKK